MGDPGFTHPESCGCMDCQRIDPAKQPEPSGEPWRLVRDADAKNGTHVLTNGRAKLSVWVGEVDDPDLASLERQLEDGVGYEPLDEPGGKRDNCDVCDGWRGGVPGNEQSVDGLVMCDYCHSTYMRIKYLLDRLEAQ